MQSSISWYRLDTTINSSCNSFSPPFIIYPGRIPLDPRLTQCLEEGRNYVEAFSGASAQKAMASIVQKILTETDKYIEQSHSTRIDATGQC